MVDARGGQAGLDRAGWGSGRGSGIAECRL